MKSLAQQTSEVAHLADEILALWDHATQLIAGAEILSRHVATLKTGEKSPPLTSALERAASLLQLLEALARVTVSSSGASYRSTIAALQSFIDGSQTLLEGQGILGSDT